MTADMKFIEKDAFKIQLKDEFHQILNFLLGKFKGKVDSKLSIYVRHNDCRQRGTYEHFIVPIDYISNSWDRLGTLDTHKWIA